MSTKYAIFENEVEREEHGHAIFNEEDEFVIIGNSHGFTRDGKIIQKYLRDTSKVYAIDNDTKVRTIKDLRKYYLK